MNSSGTISSTSSYDVVVIKHKNKTYKSTPFQSVFSDKSIKRDSKKYKLKDIQFYVNEELMDIPIRIEPNTGRVQFQKKYIKKVGNVSDSSDFSDDDRSQRSTSRQKLITSGIKSEPFEGLKNEQAPKNFWQFAWLFSSKRGQSTPKITKPLEDLQVSDEPKLARIKQQPYQGEQTSKQPLFQFSLCGHIYSKKKDTTSKEELQRIFYANKVEYKDFMKDPLSIINDPNLIVRIDNSLYTWQLGAAVLACKFAYGEEPVKLVDEVIKAKNKKAWYQIFASNNVTKLDIEKEPPSIQPPHRFDQQEIIKYRKTPDSDILEKMKLKMGQNTAKFVLQVAPGVNEQTQFQIFLWDENEKVIISDIDGTITKSDVMGQLKTNYIHKGVCLLYNQIYKRGYKLLYMTARAIGQYGQTKKFLKKEVQQNNMHLPSGPLLMSPDGYVKSFAREVIDKTPDQLKIKLLASVNQIFPSTKKPIIAGFGNRQTDSIAYLRIQIPQQKIFCITEKSVITNYNQKDFQTTYPEMLENIQKYFTTYIKPESSENSILQSSIEKNQNPILIDQNQQEILKNYHRKMSHSEFYERSPISEKNEVNSASSRTLSEEGNPNQNNAELELLVQEYMSRNKDQEEKKKAD